MKRRTFLNRSLLSGIGIQLGLPIVYAHHMPEAYVPLGLASNNPDPFKEFGLHPEMLVLNDKPWNIEAQAHLLDDTITPNERMFIRNNGLVPKKEDLENWTLQLDGESVVTPIEFTLEELKQKFNQHTYQILLECGGNGRSEFDPPAKGNQWTLGAVHCANWTGIRLKDLLEEVGYKEDAVYIGYHAKDLHLSQDPSKEAISRGIPLAKALQPETLLAFKMNGEDIPLVHGAPLRLIAGGYPASASGKWVNRLSIRNKIHDGAKMGGMSYRMPKFPVEPGTKVKEEDMEIITQMPVKSLITYPKTGARLRDRKQLDIRGHAWAGEGKVTKVEYSIDFGASWKNCRLDEPVNRMAWQHFKASINFPQKGYYEVWAKATDEQGITQPLLVPGWNPKGYLNNACHRIAVMVENG